MEILLQHLQKIQDKNGFITQEDIIATSSKFSKSPAEIYEATSFYSKFNLLNGPKKIIKICDSPTCHIKDGEKLLGVAEKLLNTKIGQDEKKFRLESCQCLGECDKGPVMMIDNDLFTNLTEKKLEQIFKEQKIL
ncbi:MAG: NAD(P)H-dependent oxidoreductase subunit E [Patescibacteria group bacterium]|nr:NAD(P)H-dependent oxidoreductase subunit E [Patescibacteria group bacterium]